MIYIKKNPETMTSKERVKRTFNFEKTDRVPIDYMANPGIHGRLAKKLGVAVEGDYVLEALGVDFRCIWPAYKGPSLFPKLPNIRTDPVYGFNMRWVEHEGGGYWDFCDFPLINADSVTIAEFPVPDPENFDYDDAYESIKKYDSYSLYIGGPGLADIINSTGRVLGMEKTLINLTLEDEATLRYIQRRCDMELGIVEKLLQNSEGDIDFLWIGEDLGTQRAPMISLEMYRRVLRPMHKRYVDMAKAYNLPVMMHCCGASSWVFEDFIQMGISAIDTLQPEAVGMDPETLVERFGGRLVFHGGISTAGALTFGTVNDVISDVKNTLAAFMQCGGYCFSPTHMIQDNSPVENVIAMYNAAHQYGSQVVKCQEVIGKKF